MSSSGKLFVGLAAVSLLIATMLGAYASHGMQDVLPQTVDTVRTAVAFQFYHGLALLVVPLLAERIDGRMTAIAGGLFVAGTVLFSGGIYASSLLAWDAAGGAAPLGGVAFMGGWAALVAAAVRAKRPPV